MVRVIDEQGVVIQEDRLGFLKRDAVLVLVGSVLPRVHSNRRPAMTYSVVTA
jgi:hypothetical protein